MERRYQLIAWVCEGGVISKVEDQGTSTFTQIYIRRPDGCRFGILYSVKDDYLVVDMYDAEWNEPEQRGFVMGDHRLFPTLDAALTAGVLTY